MSLGKLGAVASLTKKPPPLRWMVVHINCSGSCCLWLLRAYYEIIFLMMVLSSKKVQKIVAECLIDNIPSIRVLEKLNFTRTGIENGMIMWELLNIH